MEMTARRTPHVGALRGGSRQQALRAKEFLLLRRDPWLVSQSLMQLLSVVCTHTNATNHKCARQVSAA